MRPAVLLVSILSSVPSLGHATCVLRCTMETRRSDCRPVELAGDDWTWPMDEGELVITGECFETCSAGGVGGGTVGSSVIRDPQIALVDPAKPGDPQWAPGLFVPAGTCDRKPAFRYTGSLLPGRTYLVRATTGFQDRLAGASISVGDAMLFDPRGAVTVTLAKKRESVTARPSQPLVRGTTVATGAADGAADLRFRSCALHLAASTRVTLLAPDKRNTGSARLERGTVRLTLNNAVGGARLDTPAGRLDAAAGENVDMRATVDTAGNTRIEVYRGHATLGGRVEMTDGTGIFVPAGKRASTARKIPAAPEWSVPLADVVVTMEDAVSRIAVVPPDRLKVSAGTLRLTVVRHPDHFERSDLHVAGEQLAAGESYYVRATAVDDAGLESLPTAPELLTVGRVSLVDVKGETFLTTSPKMACSLDSGPLIFDRPLPLDPAQPHTLRCQPPFQNGIEANLVIPPR